MCTTHTEQLEIREEQDIENEGGRRREIPTDKCEELQGKGKISIIERTALYILISREREIIFESNPWVHSSLDIV